MKKQTRGKQHLKCVNDLYDDDGKNRINKSWRERKFDVSTSFECQIDCTRVWKGLETLFKSTQAIDVLLFNYIYNVKLDALSQTI